MQSRKEHSPTPYLPIIPADVYFQLFCFLTTLSTLFFLISNISTGLYADAMSISGHINTLLGLPVPILTTPFQLMQEDVENEN